MTPYEQVKQHYVLPFELYPFQIEAVNEHAEQPHSALYLEAGTGKTVTSIVTSLYKKLQRPAMKILVVMPPILLPNWKKNFGYFKRKDTGESLPTLMYRGSPAARKAMSIADHDVVLVGNEIFKKDYDRFLRELGHLHVHVIRDEAQSIKNVSTDNYKKFREFTMEQTLQLLTGTPLTSSPMDAYAYIKLVNRYAYKTLYAYISAHVAKSDFFGNPTEWVNLDLLEKNLMTNATRKTKEDVLKDLPPCITNVIEYDLSPKHLSLYNRLATEEMLKYEDGTKFDAATVQALWHALQQLVVNYEHFSGDENAKDIAPLDLVEEILEEIAPRKLIVFSHYKMTNRALMKRFGEKYNAIGIWGEMSAKQKEQGLAKFLDDPTCRLGVLQSTAAGVGLDGLQHVCNDVLFLEVPMTPAAFDQARSRIYRDGQRVPVNCRVAVANGTLQVRGAKALAEKQALVNSVQGGLADFKNAVFGR